MRTTLKRMNIDQRGATAIEYAMIAGLISIAAFSVLVTVGSEVTAFFSTIATSF
jgi:pilus assembly protein Flp/PilA